MYFQGNRLLEISAVPVPANGEALALRGISTQQLKSILSVEETDDSFIVTYAKYPGPGDDEDIEEEAFGDDEDVENELEDDDEMGFGEDDEDPEEMGEEEEEEGLDEDDEQDGYGGKKKPKKSVNVDTFLSSDYHLCDHRHDEVRGKRGENRAGSEHFRGSSVNRTKNEFQPSRDQRENALKSLVRDVIFELIGHDEIVRSIVYPDQFEQPPITAEDSMSRLFGIDK